jgi:hypothetical protein
MADRKQTQEVPCSLDELKAGIKLKAGHAVVLVVGGVTGTSLRKPAGDDDAADDGEQPAGDDDAAGGGEQPAGDQGATDGDAVETAASEGRGDSAEPPEDESDSAEAAPDDEQPETESAQQAETPAAASGVLENARWDANKYDHGATATASVDASNLDSKQVRFVIERLESGGWTKIEEKVVEVSNGRAEATLALEHPAAEQKGGPPRPVRFWAEPVQ